MQKIVVLRTLNDYQSHVFKNDSIWGHGKQETLDISIFLPHFGSTENDQKGKWPKGKWPPYDIYDFLQGKWQKEYDQK